MTGDLEAAVAVGAAVAVVRGGDDGVGGAFTSKVLVTLRPLIRRLGERYLSLGITDNKFTMIDIHN